MLWPIGPFGSFAVGDPMRSSPVETTSSARPSCRGAVGAPRPCSGPRSARARRRCPGRAAPIRVLSRAMKSPAYPRRRDPTTPMRRATAHPGRAQTGMPTGHRERKARRGRQRPTKAATPTGNPPVHPPTASLPPNYAGPPGPAYGQPYAGTPAPGYGQPYTPGPTGYEDSPRPRLWVSRPLRPPLWRLR